MIIACGRFLLYSKVFDFWEACRSASFPTRHLQAPENNPEALRRPYRSSAFCTDKDSPGLLHFGHRIHDNTVRDCGKHLRNRQNCVRYSSQLMPVVPWRHRFGDVRRRNGKRNGRFKRSRSLESTRACRIRRHVPYLSLPVSQTIDQPTARVPMQIQMLMVR